MEIQGDIYFLAFSALSIGFLHTLLGPDHYLPLVALAKANHWKLRKTLLITSICGIGHLVGSIIIGTIGLGAGIFIKDIEGIEAYRGDIAAWFMLSFGFLYMIWGIKKAYTKQKHSHWHIHSEGVGHLHEHAHNENEHKHLHKTIDKKKKQLGAWALFIFFILGPCEPLIPILMYPAFFQGLWAALIIILIFSGATLITMNSLVFFIYKGIRLKSTAPFERFAHMIAGIVIVFSGIGIVFLGL
jgi:ABC-type nickel/cobalt efflux system permease component RcnA